MKKVIYFCVGCDAYNSKKVCCECGEECIPVIDDTEVLARLVKSMSDDEMSVLSQALQDPKLEAELYASCNKKL